MLQTYITMMTLFVIGSGLVVVVSSLPVLTNSINKVSPYEVFESRINDHFTEFGHKMAAEIVSASSDTLRLDDVTTIVIAILTELGNQFLRSIMTIVTDILISMWYNPRPEEEIIQEMTELFTQEFYKLVQSLYDLIVYLEQHFGNFQQQQQNLIKLKN